VSAPSPPAEQVRCPGYGYRTLHQQLRRKGWAINHKLVYRLYREEGLLVRRRIRKRIAATRRQHLDAPSKPDQRWRMDFVSDALADGRVLPHPQHHRRLQPGVRASSALVATRQLLRQRRSSLPSALQDKAFTSAFTSACAIRMTLTIRRSSRIALL